MKNVLVLMHEDAGQEARFQCALDLVRALGGHLSCLDVSIMPTMADDYVLFGGAALLTADEENVERANRARMEGRLAVEGVPYDWIQITDDLGLAIRHAATLADIIVVNRELDSVEYPDMLGAASETIVTTGKPVLAVPEDVRRFDAFGHALVAWDGSRAAEAALRAAVPLLVHAERVTLLEVDDGSIGVPAFEAAEYLSRHDIKPTICRRIARDKASSEILSQIRDVKTAYLVMGGFGHSRMVEAMLGGVTRKMLREAPIPLLLAH